MPDKKFHFLAFFLLNGLRTPITLRVPVEENSTLGQKVGSIRLAHLVLQYRSV
jgi:hypothetical protein